MNAAVYTDDALELRQISDALKQCGMEFLHPISVTPLVSYTEFCQSLSTRVFDLLVIAQSGAFSLELMEAARQRSPGTPIVWFSDLDYAVRSYEYGVVWFGKKPVEPAALSKAFQRLLDRTHMNPTHLTMKE